MYTTFKATVFILCLNAVTSCTPHGNHGGSVGSNQLYSRPAPGQDGLYGPKGGPSVRRYEPCIEIDEREPVDVRGLGIRGPRAAVRGPVAARGPPGVRCPPEGDSRGPQPADNSRTSYGNQATLTFQRLLSSGASAKVIFDVLDLNGDRYVTRQEWLIKGGDSGTFVKLLQRFDTNADSRFDISEARALWSSERTVPQEADDNPLRNEELRRHPVDEYVPVRSTVRDGPNRYKGSYGYRGPQK